LSIRPTGPLVHIPPIGIQRARDFPRRCWTFPTFGLAIFSNNRGSDYGGGGFPSSLRHDKGPEKCAASARGQRQSRKMDFSISYIEEFFVALSTDYLIRK